LRRAIGSFCARRRSSNGGQEKFYLTECINTMVSLKSIHPQTRQLNLITRTSKIKLTSLWVN
jgi:hypothetical protein